MSKGAFEIYWTCMSRMRGEGYAVPYGNFVYQAGACFVEPVLRAGQNLYPPPPPPTTQKKIKIKFKRIKYTKRL
jgi:hypothetical protein